MVRKGTRRRLASAGLVAIVAAATIVLLAYDFHGAFEERLHAGPSASRLTGRHVMQACGLRSTTASSTGLLLVDSCGGRFASAAAAGVDWLHHHSMGAAGSRRDLKTLATKEGESLGVRSTTAMGDLVELHFNDWVQYHSATYDKWLMARILDLNIDGTVKLDIKDSADLNRVRALVQVKPGDVVQYDSPTFGEWIDAHVKEVLPNGLVSLDIRDDADPSRIYIPLDVHPSMIRQKSDEGVLEGGGYIESERFSDMDGLEIEEVDGANW
mmetsp:Transcript_24328/g.43157  ORF Transcript_24328/g.43157 Transcript_24328/m.43157 type:complete len:269 (-) Transcript_24328:467-1273(-)